MHMAKSVAVVALFFLSMALHEPNGTEAEYIFYSFILDHAVYFYEQNGTCN